MANLDESVILGLKGRILSIYDLLAVWGERVRRPETVQRIALDLDRHGLTTVPSFVNGPSDTLVEIKELPAPDAQSAADAADTADSTSEQADLLDAPPQAKLKVGFLPSAGTGPRALPGQSTLQQVLGQMLISQRSQIPIIDGPSTLHGVVSYKGMGHAHAANMEQTLENVMNCDPEVVRFEDDLLEVTPRIIEHGYALVRDADGNYCGIVTVEDLAAQFVTMAGPYFLVGEIERRLRRLLNKTYSEADFLALTNQKHGNADGLTFDQYKQLISPPQRWQMLGWNIDRTLFLGHLDTARIVRNQIMHFRPTPMTEAEHNHLKSLRHMLLVLDPD